MLFVREWILVFLIFKAWRRSQDNKLVVLRSRPLGALTQFSSCLPGYLFENDSRVVPEKFEGEPCLLITPSATRTRFIRDTTGEVLGDDRSVGDDHSGLYN